MSAPEKKEGPGTPEADRRSFLKTTAATAAAATAAGAVARADEPAAQPERKSKLAGSVSARFDPKRKPRLEEVHAALDRILDLHGCSKCGLLGIDIRLFLGDPPERIPGFQGVDVMMQKAVEVG
jgi:hypothetical protein